MAPGIDIKIGGAFGVRLLGTALVAYFDSADFRDKWRDQASMAPPPQRPN
jgi:hypothetical protein